MTAFFVSDGRHSGRAKVNPDLLFRLFLRSKTLMQDSILRPKYNVFWVCPAIKNQPIFTAFPVPRRRSADACGQGVPPADPSTLPNAKLKTVFAFPPLDADTLSFICQGDLDAECGNEIQFRIPG